MEPTEQTGHVLFFSAEKGFGFIIPQGVALRDYGSRVFFRGGALVDGLTLQPGEVVSYALDSNGPAPRAITVRRKHGTD